MTCHFKYLVAHVKNIKNVLQQTMKYFQYHILLSINIVSQPWKGFVKLCFPDLFIDNLAIS